MNFLELEGKVAGGVTAKAVNPFDEGSYLYKRDEPGDWPKKDCCQIVIRSLSGNLLI